MVIELEQNVRTHLAVDAISYLRARSSSLYVGVFMAGCVPKLNHTETLVAVMWCLIELAQICIYICAAN